MKSAYKRRFLSRLMEAARAGWACLLVASLLLYVPRMLAVMSVPALAPVLAILVAGPSLGTVLQNSFGIFSVSLPALASTMVVLQVLKPPISKIAAIACNGASAYVIAYLSQTHLMGRKLAIAQASIVYITAHFDAEMNVVLFPLEMILPAVLGVAAAIIASLFPFPQLAVLQMPESAKLTARGASEVFKTLVKAFSARDAGTFGSLNLHAKVLAKASEDSLTDLKQKQVDIWWEFGACGAKHANKRFSKGLDLLNLHLAGMGMAQESGKELFAPEPFRNNLQDTLLKASDQCTSLLEMAVKELPMLSTCSVDSRRRQTLIEESKNTLELFEVKWLSARKEAFYTQRAEDNGPKDVEDLWKDHRLNSTAPDPSVIKRKFRGRVSMFFFFFNVRLYFVEAINLVSAGHNAASKMHQIARIGPSMASLELAIHDNASKAQPEIHQVFLRPDDPSLEPQRLSVGRLYRDSSSRQTSRRSAVSNVSEIQNHEDAIQSGRVSSGRVMPPSLRSSLHRQCSHRNAVAMEKIITKTGDGNSGRWKFLERLGLKLSDLKAQSIRSFKTALSIVLATIFGILVLEWETQSFWAPVTVAFIIGNYQGGSWRISNLRLQGTVLGSIYGFLALTASHNHSWAILLLLVPWVIFSSFIRYSPTYGYIGLVSAFTAALLMLGGHHDDIKQYAMDRITETFVGIFCFVFVESVVFPERAAVLVRGELVSSLVCLRDCVSAIVTVYTEQQCVHCRSLAVMEIKQLEEMLKASFAKQSVLAKEAALEPDLWFVPFSADVYSKLITIQGRMLDLLFFMVCSLHATAEDCVSAQIERLLTPLRASLTALQEEVVSSIGSLQESLQVKIVYGDMLGRLKRWLRQVSGGDVEQPQSRHPNPQHPLVVLRHQRRSIDGMPLNLKSTMDSFEHSFEDMFEDMIASTKAGENQQIVSNSVIASVGSLTFSLHSLLRETVHLEKGVHELLQAENPWSVLDFWDTYSLPMRTEATNGVPARGT